MASSKSTSALQDLSTEIADCTGRTNQFEPASGNDPRAPPVNLRAAAYFQYAAWTTISQMLCRPGPGLHAACTGVTRRIEPRRFVPCHEGLRYAWSMMARSCVSSGLIAWLQGLAPPRIY